MAPATPSYSPQSPAVAPAGERSTVLQAAGSPQPVSRPTAVLPAGDAASRATRVQQIVKCPHCGYPTTSDMGSCPSCGTPISPAQRPAPTPHSAPAYAPQGAANLDDITLTCQECGQQIKGAVLFCPSCGARLHRPTVRRGVGRREILPKCSLTLVPDEDENIQPVKTDYQGKTIILNRNNTEKNNDTITSAQQAELTQEDGHWYITDKSALQSTYVHAGRRIELQSGDLIILGDRVFQFQAE